MLLSVRYKQITEKPKNPKLFSPDKFPLSEVTVSADASQSSGLLGSFSAVIKARWGNLPNVFGMKVNPLTGDLGFKHKGSVSMTIEGEL